MIYENRKDKNKYFSKVYCAYFGGDYDAVSFVLDCDFICEGKQ